MAVFYKHIKGVGENQNLWTWIKWSQEKVPASFDSLDAKFLPHIHINSTNVDPNKSNDLGYVLTSEAVGQEINKELTCFLLKGKDQQFKIYSENKQQFLQFKNNGIECSNTFRISWKGSSWQCTIDEAGNITNKGFINTDSYIKSADYIQAVYFNATSDKRAKENIHPLLTNALDIIKKVQVYTFNLKSQPEEKMVGVIAQEFLDNKLDGVSLVANEAATGKDGDYMSIRESKLVYLLLKGMQEQQVQIEHLQKRITELESK